LIFVCAPSESFSADAEWEPLLDGSGLANFHLYNGNQARPHRWALSGGTLCLRAPDNPRGPWTHEDLVITPQPAADFEFEFEWKISPGGNSGVFYKVSERLEYEKPWATGLEYQLLDNQAAEDNKLPNHRAGSAYDLVGPAKDVTAPVGSWNRSRIIVRGRRIEHWLNGERVVAFETNSTAWHRWIEASKYRSLSSFAPPGPGLIVLQDHGNAVCFRRLRLRQLESSASPP
jgi:cytochrome c